jgi:hypothetical protein
MPQAKPAPVKTTRRRLSVAAKPAPPAPAPPALPQTSSPELADASSNTVPQTLARLFRVEHGLHVLSVGPTAGSAGVLEGIALPAIQITSPPSNRFDPVEIMTTWNDTGAWLGKNGGVVVLRSPPGGGNLLITAYTEPGAPPAFPDNIEVRPIDQPTPLSGRAEADRVLVPLRLTAFADTGPALPPVEPLANPREADLWITLHISRQGDRSFPARGWVGNVGRRVQIEAFSISPRSKLSPDDLEYKAFGPQGRETQWTTNGKLCGTRGRGLPLTGFAVQPLPHMRDRFDVIYQGAFFDSGITEPCRNGEPCRPARVDDVLEAINLRVVERGG